ncbi:PREDICTED: E3 ubiquitin-protein ligase RNF181-like [Branchiostoma belcheri]|uniref:E3 ubiquitin-protein ligase RNF181 n=1 Tax=Branchiostoma belcheri TaxID=7741 RepID=A0A6P4ZMZ7_BRABE|nr:PREDICTED: E3 ubiquitin-protein ligase RNF181-like [Branchiostoma belcheri]KAI8521603.1 hypothetical protein Bbelb_013570 [Branchiostoma belcheri]
MASYFDEHDCEPTTESSTPFSQANNLLLQLARMLLEQGPDFEMDLTSLTPGERQAPPASKAAVESLKAVQITPSQAAKGASCPVCLAEFDEYEFVKVMPCQHKFHPSCILPWLSKTNSCPVCRHELPTDDPEYEEARKEKERAKEREAQLDMLHNAMYG